jgi:hypothetical protein
MWLVYVPLGAQYLQMANNKTRILIEIAKRKTNPIPNGNGNGKCTISN